MKLKPINEQVVVVCGASSGIGRKTALTLAERGAKVVVSARHDEGLESLVEEIRSAGGEATAVAADVTRFSDMQAVADMAADTYGRIDTWIQTAAISLYAKFEETEPDEFARVIEVNLIGTAHAAKAALPHLKKTAQQDGGAALICTSSVEGKRAMPLQSAYASSKHGIIGMLDAIRVELQEEGVPVSVTNVMPAGINTPLFNKARTKMGVKPMPVPPIYEPDVVANVMLYAAQHPTRDISAGGAAKSFIWGQKFTPRMLDKVLTKTGFAGQMTDEPKSADAPANLYKPVDGEDRVYGDFSDQAKGSIATWFDTHPMAGRVIKGAALAGVAFAVTRAMRTR
jgi:NAD(P)-dependent dehydrogenase (short-subunit alcohol dehydrogenase family)